MDQNFCTAISHACLVGTSVYCFRKYHKYSEMDMPCFAFGIIAIHSMIGVYRWGFKSHGSEIEEDPFTFTCTFRNILVMPCIAGQMCIRAGYEENLGYLHPVISSVPLVGILIGKDVNQHLKNVLIGLNILSCAMFSFVKEKFWGVAAAVLYMCIHFGRTRSGDVPNEILYNYCMCVFTYCAYRAVRLRDFFEF